MITKNTRPYRKGKSIDGMISRDKDEVQMVRAENMHFMHSKKSFLLSGVLSEWLVIGLVWTAPKSFLLVD